MRNKVKAKTITALMFILLCVLAADVVTLVDGSLPWVLGIFAIPGGIWFVKTLYKWIADDEDEDDAIRFPLPNIHKKPKGKSYAQYKQERWPV